MIAETELATAATQVRSTPVRVFLPKVARRRFTDVANRVSGLSTEKVRFQAAYSVKTNPDVRFVDSARASGMLAETIGPEEFRLARSRGFADDEIIYNGPFALESGFGRPHIAFADSPAALERYLGEQVAHIPGVRIRPNGIRSRFGVIEAELPAVCALLRTAPQGEAALSFHVREEDIAPRSWPEILASVLAAGAILEREGGRRIVALDVGGGRGPEAFDAWLHRDLAVARRDIFDRLPHVRMVFVEPGQEVATPCECLVASILEERGAREPREVVVDATIGQLSHRDSYAHRIFVVSEGRLQALEPGADRILGSACLEDDILADGVRLPALRPGDRIVIADCGSYDASMTSPFATGMVWAITPRPHAGKAEASGL